MLLLFSIILFCSSLHLHLPRLRLSPRYKKKVILISASFSGSRNASGLAAKSKLRAYYLVFVAVFFLLIMQASKESYFLLSPLPPAWQAGTGIDMSSGGTIHHVTCDLKITYQVSCSSSTACTFHSEFSSSKLKAFRHAFPDSQANRTRTKFSELERSSA